MLFPYCLWLLHRHRTAGDGQQLCRRDMGFQAARKPDLQQSRRLHAAKNDGAGWLGTGAWQLKNRFSLRYNCRLIPHYAFFKPVLEGFS
ncbi:hypothetical protein [Polaromonas naphthalenivorans]|uniref:hypothetical protein n=1 Tax=Polaromonas naphthalenivorans TaxID=216465 RepID=UPI0012ED2C08|nr:hypothetical protein [Polaromonas naphthalenivorans]MBH2009021.1 hypothetical protein [Xanthomonadaceae bacterium]